MNSKSWSICAIRLSAFISKSFECVQTLKVMSLMRLPKLKLMSCILNVVLKSDERWKRAPRRKLVFSMRVRKGDA